MTQSMAGDDEFRALRAFSAMLGDDSAKTQAAGGNTSLKREGIMWIKASGTWLAHALDRDIMVPVRIEPLRAALAGGDPRAETAVDFVDQAANVSNLRPSIETSVHAVIPHAVVAHIHCVETLALAARQDGEARIGERLAPLEDVAWAFVPYCRPGVPLSAAIAARQKPETNVLVLGNHGLVVSGASVAEVEDRLDRVCLALASPARPAPPADLGRLEDAVRGSDYRLPADLFAHGVALDPVSFGHVRQGSLYPDHVIFLGPGIVETDDVAAGAAIRREEAKDGPPAMLLLRGLGVVLHRSTTPAADALARCLWDVASRIPADAVLNYLSKAQDYELTHWEAEQYRQTLDAKTRAKEAAP
ncbi:class II aldolase/adducin family protein [Labrys monachus]|uniref:Rhamnose utilization protein RhaD (Predicted bifunctional aldolase and dehydrogenase) n=1 Tax=Labrys monachus TaxID=217067 RepID=A0ABU0FMT8_9HYPH|nr:class II aldolase/adducin family protein [Labrys monachus]MDQ0395672.1 rhamnose utilization protein RhaD (predicted bifunctional aldolase and dehydrogenase) [Labrys monachus]